MDPIRVKSLRIFNRLEQHRIFGLTGFAIRFEQGVPDCPLRITVGQQSRSLTIAEMTDSRPGCDPEELRFCLASQLLPGGPTSLQISSATGTEADRQILARYDVVVDNHGALASDVAEALQRSGAHAISGAVVDAAMWPYPDPAGVPWFEDDGEREGPPPLSLEPSTDTAHALRHLREYGFCLLPETVPHDLCDDLNSTFDRLFQEGKLSYTWGSSQRITDMHRTPPGRAIWTFPPAINFLRTWLQDEPVACQTLYYCFGSQQSAHQDTIHLTPYPAGYMCGVWVALQDIVADSGELFVYPGSHRLPRLRATELGLSKVSTDYSSYSTFDAEIARMVQGAALSPVAYRPHKGWVLVWHENLIHGGNPRLNKELERRSIVSHYFARGSVAYYDSRGEPAVLEEVPG